MSHISNKEIALNLEQIKDYVYNDKPIASGIAKDWLRRLLEGNERFAHANWELSNQNRELQQERDCYKLWLERNQAELLKSDIAKARMREDMQRIVERAELALDETDAYGFKVGLTAIRQLARPHVADIEKGAEVESCVSGIEARPLNAEEVEMHSKVIEKRSVVKGKLYNL